jgi:3-dehydro-L-gulonate 2-dehydrogenase
MNSRLKAETLRIPAPEMQSLFQQVLLKNQFPPDKATVCSEVFTNNSLEGVYSHGINRFAKFISYVKTGLVKPDANPVSIAKAGVLEQWEGHSGIGITNALACTRRAMEIAKESGMGCVAIAHTNHWMRGGTYGRLAASQGFIFIGWTNTIQNTPAWGAVDPRLGNNPLVIGVPFGKEPIVLDMAMSQYSYGALDLYRMKGEKLPVPGGFDRNGNLSHEPDLIMESKRTLPIGYWKGSGLSLLLDILATILSGGLSVSEISKQNAEAKLSQVFIAFDIKQLNHQHRVPGLLRQIIDDLHRSIAVEKGAAVRYPGERVVKTREENIREGIPVLKEVWNEVLALVATQP